MGSSQIGGRKLLGQTLKKHRRDNFREMTQKKLEDNAQKGKNIEGKGIKEKLRLEIDNGFIGKLERGEIEGIELGDLPALADLYQIGVLSLIYSFPREVPLVFNTLYRDDLLSVKENGTFISVPFDFPTAEGLRYWIPITRLAGSSLILLKIQLFPGGYTPYHPGHEEDEVVEVLKGEVLVEFPILGQNVRLSEGDRVYFKYHEHIIKNPSSHEEAVVFIQRELNELEDIRKEK